jgi:hypothetical protein
MITTIVPEDWRALQENVARILTECGFAVELEKEIHTVRGDVEIDVYAEETVDGRLYTLLCECKRWKTNVPQGVVHGFRTVVADAGANVGYIISSAGFQSGAFSAADLTNLRLVTWGEFQAEFERSWIENFLLPQVRERFDLIFHYTEPLVPREVADLTDEGQRQFVALHKKHLDFGMLMMLFTPSAYDFINRGRTPELPIRDRLRTSRDSTALPDTLIDARSYREFLEAATEYGESALAEFRLVLTTMTGP